MTNEGSRIAVVTVHGTGDTADGPSGDKWFQDGSRFWGEVSARLAQAGLVADLQPFLWSGANSARAREAAGEKLAAFVRKLAKNYDALHIIGHSHGGNVANEALLDLRWGHGRRNRSKVAGVVAVGTPFLETRSAATFAVTWFIQLACAILGIAALVSLSRPLEMASTDAERLLLAGLFAIPPIFLVVLSAARFRKQQIASRAAPKQKLSKTVVSIWHPNDEAISFLQTVHALRLEPFPRGALFRAAEGVASIFAARMAVLFTLFAAIVFGAMQTRLMQHELQSGFGVPQTLAETAVSMGALFNDPLAPVWLVLAIGPIAYFLTYILVRVVYGLVPELARSRVNVGVTGAVQGFAFGRDSERQILRSAPTSFSHECRTIEIDGACAERMKSGAADSVTRLIEKYRWSMFSVGSDTTSVLADISNDTMTWDSLIHTTYFDQPEVADLIVAEIVGASNG